MRLLMGMLVSLLAACSEPDVSANVGDDVRSGAAPLADPTRTATLPVVLPGDPSHIEAMPDTIEPNVIAVEILSDSGLRVAYTDAAQLRAIDARRIGAQWQYMQGCTGIVAPAPLVVVVAGTVEPLTSADDVLRDIEGRITASASASADGIATLQVHENDFGGDADDTSADAGFVLRSIMGRHLWRSAMLLARDYPYRCARANGDAVPTADDRTAPGTVRGQAVRSVPSSAGAR